MSLKGKTLLEETSNVAFLTLVLNVMAYSSIHYSAHARLTRALLGYPAERAARGEGILPPDYLQNEAP